MTTDLDHSLGKTAQYVAHCRALESAKPKPLITDPFASAFAGCETHAIMNDFCSYVAPDLPDPRAGGEISDHSDISIVVCATALRLAVLIPSHSIPLT